MTTLITAPATTAVRTLTRVESYDRAERLVDRLSEAGFPVERVRVVGIDMYRVRPDGAPTGTGRTMLAGATTGAAFGLVVGLVFGALSLGTGWPLMVLGGALIGLFSGATIDGLTRRARRGGPRRLRAHRYAVEVEAAHADDARHILGLP